jgi:hypothetical protein
MSMVGSAAASSPAAAAMPHWTRRRPADRAAIPLRPVARCRWAAGAVDHRGESGLGVGADSRRAVRQGVGFDFAQPERRLGYLGSRRGAEDAEVFGARIAHPLPIMACWGGL